MGNGASSTKKELLLIPNPVVETEYGKIEGLNVSLPHDKQKRMAKVFLGIPFAKPPIGKLRFEKPQRPDKWTETLECKKQASPGIQKVLPWLSKFHGNEDCLYLNIIAPAWDSPDPNGFPVMFYIHGGGFVMGSSASYHYLKICRMLTRHGVIVVTTQYRLGLLGYFCTSDDTALGNYGLWDQYFALKFISDNIAAFGGNPANITIFGQSAGAVSCDLLSISPLSRDLISKVVCLGGNCETMWGVSARRIAADFCQNLAIKLGFKRTSTEPTWSPEENKELVAFLKELPPQKFAMTMLGSKAIFEKMRLDVSPVIDGEIIPYPPHILRQLAPPRPIISGITAQEGLIFISLGQKIRSVKLAKDLDEKFDELLDILYNFMECDPIILDEFRRLYDLSDLSTSDPSLLKLRSVEMISDMVNNSAWFNLMSAERERGSQIWSFIFEHHNPKILMGLKVMLPMNTATHGTEIVYIFDHNLYKIPFRRTKTDHAVSLKMTTMLTNFAKYGNPNGDDTNNNSLPLFDFVWEPVTNDFPQRHLIVSAKSELSNNLNKDTLEKWSPYYQKLARYFCDDKFWINAAAAAVKPDKSENDADTAPAEKSEVDADTTAAD